MAELSIHQVNQVNIEVGQPQEDILGELYCITKIRIHTKRGEEHLVTLFGARHELGEDDRHAAQLAVHPFVEYERPKT